MSKAIRAREKPKRLPRPQAGVITPVIPGPNKRSAEGTKEFLLPLQGFRMLDAHYLSTKIGRTNSQILKF